MLRPSTLFVIALFVLSVVESTRDPHARYISRRKRYYLDESFLTPSEERELHEVHEEIRRQRMRVQRASAKKAITLTKAQQKEVVEAHNEIRRQEMATDMRVLEWHEGLAAAASGAAETCEWTRSAQRELKSSVKGFDTVTESVYISSGKVNFDTVVRTWAEEKDSYQYQSRECNKVCWHYTQIVWAMTHAIGCAIEWCPVLDDIPWGKHGGYLFICLYGPGGNSDGDRPFTKGDETCSNCTDDFSLCLNGLCGKLTVFFDGMEHESSYDNATSCKYSSGGGPVTSIGGFILAGLLFIQWLAC